MHMMILYVNYYFLHIFYNSLSHKTKTLDFHRFKNLRWGGVPKVFTKTKSFFQEFYKKLLVFYNLSTRTGERFQEKKSQDFIKFSLRERGRVLKRRDFSWKNSLFYKNSLYANGATMGRIFFRRFSREYSLVPKFIKRTYYIWEDTIIGVSAEKKYSGVYAIL